MISIVRPQEIEAEGRFIKLRKILAGNMFDNMVRYDKVIAAEYKAQKRDLSQYEPESAEFEEMMCDLEYEAENHMTFRDMCIRKLTECIGHAIGKKCIVCQCVLFASDTNTNISCKSPPEHIRDFAAAEMRAGWAARGIETNISPDRIANDKYHTLDNLRFDLCRDCNCKKGAQNTNPAAETKARLGIIPPAQLVQGTLATYAYVEKPTAFMIARTIKYETIERRDLARVAEDLFTSIVAQFHGLKLSPK